mgnify:CR=1 FL=1|jgi:hypothetical protein
MIGCNGHHHIAHNPGNDRLTWQLLRQTAALDLRKPPEVFVPAKIPHQDALPSAPPSVHDASMTEENPK